MGFYRGFSALPGPLGGLLCAFTLGGRALRGNAHAIRGGVPPRAPRKSQIPPLRLSTASGRDDRLVGPALQLFGKCSKAITPRRGGEPVHLLRTQWSH